jgi:hypothetical protein
VLQMITADYGAVKHLHTLSPVPFSLPHSGAPTNTFSRSKTTAKRACHGHSKDTSARRRSSEPSAPDREAIRLFYLIPKFAVLFCMLFATPSPPMITRATPLLTSSAGTPRRWPRPLPRWEISLNSFFCRSIQILGPGLDPLSWIGITQ